MPRVLQPIPAAFLDEVTRARDALPVLVGLHCSRVDAFPQFDDGTPQLALDEPFQCHFATALLWTSGKSSNKPLQLDVVDRRNVLEKTCCLLDERNAVAAQEDARGYRCRRLSGARPGNADVETLAGADR